MLTYGMQNTKLKTLTVSTKKCVEVSGKENRKKNKEMGTKLNNQLNIYHMCLKDFNIGYWNCQNITVIN